MLSAAFVPARFFADRAVLDPDIFSLPENSFLSLSRTPSKPLKSMAVPRGRVGYAFA
jgi:hypothetical protein